MLSVTEIANQYAWLYTELPTPAGTWTHLIPTDGAYAAIYRAMDGTDYVMFRGSVTFLDWIEDFAHFAVPYDDPTLGGVHPGFRLGIDAVRAQIDALVGDHVVIVGHSLGAGHASLCAGYRLAAGKPVDALVLFGEPKAGGSILARTLASVEVFSYRNMDANGHDLVTDVPFSAPPILNYQHPRPLIDVSAAPDPNDLWLMFRYHHFGLYCRALGATGQAALSLPM